MIGVRTFNDLGSFWSEISIQIIIENKNAIQVKRQYFLLFLIFLSTVCHSQQADIDQISKLKAAITSDKYPNIDGVLVSHNDSVIIEAYFNGFGRDSLHDTRSAFKSITSLLAGIAIDQGLFMVEDEVQSYITEWKDDPKGKMTIKDLLQMKSGLACEGFFGIGPDCESEMSGKKDWLE